jgi:hypothetical protein
MSVKPFTSLLVLAILGLGAYSASAQSADNLSPLTPITDEKCRKPKSVCDMLKKMKIEREKKEYQVMLERGEDALKLSEELEASIESNGGLTAENREKLADLEKLVKKIRGEIGGDDDDGDETEEKPATVADGIKKLKDATVSLLGELKRMTRFSISAAAITTSNSILRLTKFLRSGR